MNALTPITTMTAEMIDARMDEIARLERKHAARNLDAELAEAMRAGSDVDALETLHLEAERAARRLRVERQALEAERPAAIRRSGAAALSMLKERHDLDTGAMAQVIDELERDWNAFLASWSAFQQLQDDALVRADQALTLTQKTGAGMPEIGNFKSARVEVICDQLRPLNILGVLASVGTAAVNGKSTVID